MAQYSGSQKARLEQQRRQRQFYERQREKAANKKGKKKNNDDTYFFFEYSEWRMRRLAPFALLIHSLTILFLLSWFISARSYEVSNFHFNGIGEVEIPADNGLYKFNIKQNLPTDKAPLYSELEIEILDENFDHVYSVYKDLWQELYQDENYRTKLYSDLNVEFKLELQKAGIYHIRTISHNNNYGLFTANVSKMVFGGMYFPFYSILFGVLSVLLFFASPNLGSPSDMLAVLPKLRSWKQNRAFHYALGVALVLFIGCWVAAFNNYGFASGGDKTVLPTYFFRNNAVTYLG